jgi:hypothetical protein
LGDKIQGRGSFRRYDDEYFDEDNVKGDSLLDLQAGHGTHVAGMIYARLMSLGKFKTTSQMEQSRLVCFWIKSFFRVFAFISRLGSCGEARGLEASIIPFLYALIGAV